MQFKILLPSAILALFAIPTASSAQGVSLASGFTDFSTWSLYGSATAINATPGNGFTYSNLELTLPGTGGSAGAGFAPDAITLDFNQAFSFDFHFFIPANTGIRGDGLTFTLSDAPGVGGGGSVWATPDYQTAWHSLSIHLISAANRNLPVFRFYKMAMSIHWPTPKQAWEIQSETQTGNGALLLPTRHRVCRMKRAI